MLLHETGLNKINMDIQYIQMMANGYNANPINQGGQPQEGNHNPSIKLVKTD